MIRTNLQHKTITFVVSIPQTFIILVSFVVTCTSNFFFHVTQQHGWQVSHVGSAARKETKQQQQRRNKGIAACEYRRLQVQRRMLVQYEYRHVQ